MLHTIPIGFNQTFLKHFQFNANATYIDHWNFQTTRQRFGRGSIPGQDTLTTDTVAGFKRAGEYNLNAGVSTKIYNTIQFKGNGSLRAIRHVMTPSLSFSYRPDFSNPSYGYYRTIVSQATIPYPYTSRTYSIFQSSEAGGPAAGRSAGIGFTLDNTVEAKVKAKSTDTSGTDRKISILQGLSFSTFYNFAADSFRLSPVTFNGHTAIFNQKLGINFSGSFNPYEIRVIDSVSNGQIVRTPVMVNKYSFEDGKFPMLSNFTLSMDISLNSATLHQRQNIQPAGSTVQNMTQNQAQRLALINSDPSAYVDFNIPYNIVLNYSYNYTNNGALVTTFSTINGSGDFNLTPKWKIQYTTGYDLKAEKLSLTTFSIYRDLHCWDLSFRWVPFGLYKSFSVDLKVKAAILQDLKLSKRKDYYNNQ